MRSYLLLAISALLATPALAQSSELKPRPTRTKPLIYSATSEWQKVTFRPTARLRPGNEQSTTQTLQPVRATNRPITTQPTETPAPTRARYAPPAASSYRPAFTGDFATNRNGWRAGIRGDYHYQIGMGTYNIRKRNANTSQTAFSYVALPSDMNLNIASQFTIKVDIVADSGNIPTGGLLFGVRDSLNYCSFALNSKGEVAISRIVNGKPADDMPGDYFRPGVLMPLNRVRLIIERKNNALHFYVEDREIRSSPYIFNRLPGNGIGMTTNGYWTSFQKLTVTLGP